MPEEGKTLLTFWSVPCVIELSSESKSGCDSLVIMAEVLDGRFSQLCLVLMDLMN